MVILKNAPKSIAMRHQHDMAYHMIRNRNLDKKAVVGPGSSIVLAALWNGKVRNEAMGCIGLYFELYHANWVSIKSTKYKCECYLLTKYDSESEMFQFLQVVDL